MCIIPLTSVFEARTSEAEALAADAVARLKRREIKASIQEFPHGVINLFILLFTVD